MTGRGPGHRLGPRPREDCLRTPSHRRRGGVRRPGRNRHDANSAARPCHRGRRRPEAVHVGTSRRSVEQADIKRAWTQPADLQAQTDLPGGRQRRARATTAVATKQAGTTVLLGEPPAFHDHAGFREADDHRATRDPRARGDRRAGRQGDRSGRPDLIARAERFSLLGFAWDAPSSSRWVRTAQRPNKDITTAKAAVVNGSQDRLSGAFRPARAIDGAIGGASESSDAPPAAWPSGREFHGGNGSWRRSLSCASRSGAAAGRRPCRTKDGGRTDDAGRGREKGNLGLLTERCLDWCVAEYGSQPGQENLLHVVEPQVLAGPSSVARRCMTAETRAGHAGRSCGPRHQPRSFRRGG